MFSVGFFSVARNIIGEVESGEEAPARKMCEHVLN